MSISAPTLPNLDVKEAVGLSDDEAAARLLTDGPNELASTKPRSLAAIAWDVVREPMLLLLVLPIRADGSRSCVSSARLVANIFLFIHHPILILREAPKSFLD
jgi:Cation transporter/ATPase, N-terminus